VPASLAGGVTTSVASVPLTRVNAPAVPPATAISSAVKLVPTSSLKVKVNVTGPVAVSPAALLVISTAGGVVSSYSRRTWSSSTGPRRPAGTVNPMLQIFDRSGLAPRFPRKAENGTVTSCQPVKLSGKEALKVARRGFAW